MKATSKLLVGRTIVDVQFWSFAARPGLDRSTADDPVITLDNGARLHFITQETEVGEYGTHIEYVTPSRPRKKQQRKT